MLAEQFEAMRASVERKRPSAPSPRPAAALTGAAILTLVACVSPPPRPAAPALAEAAPLSETGQGQGWPSREWWREFHDTTLDALIDGALTNAPDLAAATARFDSARAGVAAARAAAGVQTGLSTDASRQRLSDHGLFPPDLLGFHWYSQFDLGLQASYAFDWWGRQRAAIAAALGTARAAQAEREAAALALASSTAEIYFGWQSDMAERELAVQRAEVAGERLRIAAARIAAHVDREDAYERAELAQSEARDRVDELTASAQLRQVALAALEGVAPADLPALAARSLPALHAELPADASLDLIARRPDIVAARARVAAALQHVEVARDDFLPDLSLSALLGLSSQQIGTLLQPGSFAPTVSAALHVPLFGAGTLRAELARSEAGLADNVANYRAAVLGAAREVNTQLLARRRWIEQTQLRSAQLAAAGALNDSAARRMQQGITDARAGLDTQDELLAIQQAQLQTRAAALQSELELIRALGGGYRREAQP